jgi:hypothetical protein
MNFMNGNLIYQISLSNYLWKNILLIINSSKRKIILNLKLKLLLYIKLL